VLRFRNLVAGISIGRSGFSPRPGHATFLVDKVRQFRLSSECFGFPLSAGPTGAPYSFVQPSSTVYTVELGYNVMKWSEYFVSL
jgi:hypothetical protein